MFEPKLRAPLNIEWEVTNVCNLRCRHCYVSAGEKLQSELTTKEASKLIKELDQIGVTDITLSGGEPFLRLDIWEIINEIAKRGIPFFLYTNGTLLDNTKVKKLAALDAKMISLSLNGGRPRTHNFVQNAPTFNKVIKTMRAIKRSNIGLQLLFTLMKINAGEIEEMFDLAEEEGVDAVCIYPFHPSGRGKNALQQLELDPKKINHVLTKALSLSRDYPFKVYVGGCLGRLYSPTQSSSLVKGAPCAKLMAVITADGHLRPCNFLPYRTKHGVREKKITELWADPLFQKIRNWNKSTRTACSRCEQFQSCLGMCLNIHMQKPESTSLISELECLGAR